MSIADMTAALECRRPSAVPIWELEFHAWDAASGQHVVLGKEMETLSPAQRERAMYRNAEIILSVCREMNYSALTTPSGYWEQSPGELAYFVLGPDTRFRQAEILKQLAGDDIMIVGSTWGVIGASYDPDFCEKLFVAPEEIDAYAREALKMGIEGAKRFRDLGAGAVFSASDIADNSGPFYNPQQMKRFILPYLDTWAREVEAMGMYSILHTDGQLTRYLDDIATTSVHALQAIDPVAGMDMAEARRIVGDRLCLCGNIDCGLLLRGTPEQVYEATKTVLQTDRDGGLVLGASNAVQPEVPLDNYRAMIAAWRRHGEKG